MNLLKSMLLLPGARCLALCLLAGALSACGQRGPLFLPPPPAGASSAPQQQLPAKSDDGVKNPTTVDDIKPQRPAR